MTEKTTYGDLFLGNQIQTAITTILILDNV